MMILEEEEAEHAGKRINRENLPHYGWFHRYRFGDLKGAGS
jgi:hypothetical protein